MHPVLRLYEDVLSSAENVEFQLAPLPRFIFLVHGSATIDGKAVNEGEAWQSEGGVAIKPGSAGCERGRGSPGAVAAARVSQG